jgi:aryl-alcohol dehydrogenase-like predicted oxidoreductase
MKYTQLGHCGLQVSRVCLGMMSFGNPPPGHPSWRAWHLTGDGARGGGPRGAARHPGAQLARAGARSVTGRRWAPWGATGRGQERR